MHASPCCETDIGRYPHVYGQRAPVEQFGIQRPQVMQRQLESFEVALHARSVFTKDDMSMPPLPTVGRNAGDPSTVSKDRCTALEDLSQRDVDQPNGATANLPSCSPPLSSMRPVRRSEAIPVLDKGPLEKTVFGGIPEHWFPALRILGQHAKECGTSHESSTHASCDASLKVKDAAPQMACLVRGQTSKVDMPEELQPMFETGLQFHGSPCQLVVFQARPSDSSHHARISPAIQVIRMRNVIEDWKPTCHCWPLHDKAISYGIVSEEVLWMVGSGKPVGKWSGRLRSMLRVLHIMRPPEDKGFIEALRSQFGSAVAFYAIWSYFYVQQLWLLAALCFLWFCFGIQFDKHRARRIQWEVAKACVVLWGSGLALCTHVKLAPRQTTQQALSKVLHVSRKRSQYDDSQDFRMICSRWARFLFLAVPALLIYLAFACLLLLSATNLTLHVIYVWGDCMRLPQPCRDPQKKHGLLGWLVEVSCDVTLALIFEGLFLLARGLGDWIASLRNYEHVSDHQFFAQMFEISLATLERIGFVACLGFAFAPQWVEPHTSTDVNMADCSDFTFGESSIFCLQRRLSLDMRRSVFEKLTKGPFCVAPFINVLVKVIIPWTAHKMFRVSYALPKLMCLKPFRGLARTVALIFAYDPKSVGGPSFIFYGWPFSERFESLRQFVRKPFNADDEMIYLQMNFVWVMFFAPMMPVGVLFTLAARIIECSTGVRKILYLQRRTVPETDHVMRRRQNAFVSAVAVASVGWSAGLSLITYNDDLWRWGFLGEGIMIAVALWLFCAALLCFRFNQYRTSESAFPYVDME